MLGTIATRTLIRSSRSAASRTHNVCCYSQTIWLGGSSRISQNSGSSFSNGIFSYNLNPTETTKRFYTPMTPEEEEKEKARVSHLSPEEKEEELRQWNRKLAKYEMLKGINTGELYTWTGRYKALLRNYGLPLFVYYWGVYGTMAVSAYMAIDFGGLDAMALIAKVDGYTGFSLAEKVDPALGKIGLALVVNEVLEPVRLPFVVATLKPVMETISPPKY